jgi:glycosyltransferase involved in cell wall biosynthesis
MYEIDPDIIHFHTQFAVGAQAIFIAKMLKKPLIATFHGYFWEPEYLKLYKLDKLDKGKTISNLGWKYNNFSLGRRISCFHLQNARNKTSLNTISKNQSK